MEFHLKATGCHLLYMGSYSVTCRPTQLNTPRLNPSQRPVGLLDLPTLEGCKAELTQVTSYIPKWCTQTVTHLSIYPTVRGWKTGSRINLRPVDHKSDALITTSPSYLKIINRFAHPYWSVIEVIRGASGTVWNHCLHRRHATMHTSAFDA